MADQAQQTGSEFFGTRTHIDDRVLALVKKVINHTHGQTENLDIKKMKGAWKGYHRVRMGKIRMILKIDFEKHIVFVDRIDFRGNVYK